MPGIYDGYAGAPGSNADTTTGPSSILFSRFDAMERDGRVITQFEDFSSFRFGVPGSTETYWSGGWKAIGTATNATFTRVDAATGGCTLTLTADNEYLHMNKSSNPFEISRTSQPLAFEARLKVSSIADTVTDFFVGLGKPMTLTTIVPITTTAGDLATEDLVGIYRSGADGDELNSVCCSADATHTTIQDGLTTLVADTYVKVGFLWDPTRGDYNLRFFVNGVPSATTHTVSATAGDTFPNNVRLGLLIGSISCGAAGTHTVSWIKCSQFRASST